MSVLKFFQLCFFKVRVDLTAESKRTYIGMLWWILDPLIWMLVFYVVFALLLERRTEDFTDFLLCGLVFWRWFAQSVANGQMAIVQGRGLMQQIYIPKEFFVLVNVLSDLFKLLVVVLTFLAYLYFRGYSLSGNLVYLPALIAIELLFVIGASFILAAIIPMIPDVKYLVDNFMIVGMFLSGIFYDGRELPPEKQELFYLNPMAKLVESYRIVLLEDGAPELSGLAYPVLIAFLVLLTGILIIRVLDRHYPKIVKQR